MSAIVKLRRPRTDLTMSELLAAVRRLVDLLNQQAASGLITREIILQTLRVDQMLHRIEAGEDPRSEEIRSLRGGIDALEREKHDRENGA